MRLVWRIFLGQGPFRFFVCGAFSLAHFIELLFFEFFHECLMRLVWRIFSRARALSFFLYVVRLVWRILLSFVFFHVCLMRLVGAFFQGQGPFRFFVCGAFSLAHFLRARAFFDFVCGAFSLAHFIELFSHFFHVCLMRLVWRIF